MNDEPDKREDKHGTRQDRLKLALRENLKRRKSQARGRNATPGSAGEDDTSSSKQDRKE
jgi:hypothetical protein